MTNTRDFPTTGIIAVKDDWIAQKVDVPQYTVRMANIGPDFIPGGESWDYRRDNPGIIENEARSAGVHMFAPLMIAWLMTLEHDYRIERHVVPSIQPSRSERICVRARPEPGRPWTEEVAVYMGSLPNFQEVVEGERARESDLDMFPVADLSRQGIIKPAWGWIGRPVCFRSKTPWEPIAVGTDKDDGEIPPDSPLGKFLKEWK